MTTVFTRIIRGELPGVFVWRDDVSVGFLSINPMAFGHTLVVPRVEVDHWIDAEPELLRHLFDVSRIVGIAQQRAFQPERVGIIVAGYEVPHLHIHVIPTNDMSELSFAHAAPSVSRDTLEDAAARIQDALGSLGYSHGCD
jgi:histidine triad (HIT) family protein